MSDGSNSPPQQAAGTIDLETAAKLAKCTPRHIQQLVKDGFIPRPERGRYTIIGVVHGRIDSLKDEERRSSKTASASALQNQRAEEIRVRTAERLKTLQAAAVEAGLALIDHVMGPARSDLQSIPPRRTNDLTLRKLLEADINAVLDKVAERSAAYRSDEGSAVRADKNAAPTKARRLVKAKSDVSGKRGRSRAKGA